MMMTRMLIKHIGALFIVTALVATLAGCGGGGAEPPNTGTQRITGRVTDATDPTRGVSNAVVKLFPNSRSGGANSQSRQAPIAQTTTDERGNFALVADTGEYLLRVELPDGSYQAVEIGVTVTGNINLSIRIVPRTIRIARVEIVTPPGDGPGGSYLVGKSYRFRARAFDPNGQEISVPLVPNWQVVGGIGTITDDGTFTAASPGTGKIIAIFTSDKRFEATITVSQAPGTNQKPSKPSLIEPENQAVVTGRPNFRFSASDSDGDRLRFKVEILKNGVPFRTYDQTQDTAGWSKPDYASGETATFIPPSPLPAGDYQWLVYAYDGRDWSEGSETRFFTVNNPPTNLNVIAPNDNALVDKRPQFKISATDPDGDRLRFKIELLRNGSVVKVYDQTVNSAGWDRTDYPSGAVATFTTDEPLSTGNYQWRFYAFDGRTWSDPTPVRNFSVAPLAILVGSNQSAPLQNLLISNGFRVSLQDTLPTNLGDADVLIIDDTLSLSTSDAFTVEQYLNEGKSVVLIGHAPAMLATGERLPTNGQRVDISAISAWFGGVNQMQAYATYVYARDPGLFPLPSGITSDRTIYSSVSEDSRRMASCTTPPVPPGRFTAVDVKGSLSPNRIYGFAYPLASGARLYWQWAHTGNNPAYAEKVSALFIAGVRWAAKVQ
jgi:hypothetical protein